MTLAFRSLVLGACLLVPVVPVAAQPAVVSSADPQTVGPSEEAIQQLLEEIQAEQLLQGIEVDPEVDTGPTAGWPDLTALALEPPIREIVHPSDRSVRLVTRPLRHTTILLPPEERIVDFVVGDGLYFEVTGADNVAFVKPMQANRRTSVSFTTNLDHAYSFDVFATLAVRPDEVLRVRWPGAEQVTPGESGGGVVAGFHARDFGLDFVASDTLGAIRQRIDTVRAQQVQVEAEAARQLASVERLAERRFEEFRTTFPRRIEARYRLSPEIQSAPLFVHQIFTDGQFTYLRSSAQESPALYTLSGADGSEPILANVTLTPNGLYVIDHVVSAGYAQLRGARGEWHLWDLPPSTILPEVVRAGLPVEGLPPRWIRVGESRSWAGKHPKLLKWLLGSALAGTVTLTLVLR